MSPKQWESLTNGCYLRGLGIDHAAYDAMKEMFAHEPNTLVLSKVMIMQTMKATFVLRLDEVVHTLRKNALVGRLFFKFAQDQKSTLSSFYVRVAPEPAGAFELSIPGLSERLGLACTFFSDRPQAPIVLPAEVLARMPTLDHRSIMVAVRNLTLPEDKGEPEPEPEFVPPFMRRKRMRDVDHTPQDLMNLNASPTEVSVSQIPDIERIFPAHVRGTRARA